MDVKTEQSRNHYNQIASQYDDSFEGKFTLGYNQMLCDCVLLRDGDTVLDVACGNGRLLRMLLRIAKIRAYGVDVSEEMISIARSQYPEMQFSAGSAEHLDFPDNTFDAITVCCAFHHFTNPELFVKEARRVLKPGGNLYIADLSPFGLLRWLENIYFSIAKMGDVKLYSNRELGDFYTKAGFSNVRIFWSDSRVIVEGEA